MRPGSIRCIAMGFLVGCYSPTLPENQPCSETQNCPEGLACDLASNECVSEVPQAARYVKISAYFDHACGIDLLGALWCWGRNEDAVLGTGDTDRRLEPTRVGVESDWFDIEAGEDITCGLRAVDQLWCWGDALDLNGTILNPRQVSGAFKKISAGHDAWCAIGVDNTLTCHRDLEAAPTVQPTSIVPTDVEATHNTTCVIDTAQQLFCWGANESGQVGTGDTIDVDIATPNQIAGTWASVEIGDAHTCAIDVEGVLKCWGRCGAGQLGRLTDCFSPIRVDERRWLSVSAGTDHTCGITEDGNLSCFGSNSFGELASRGGIPSLEPLEIEGFGGWTAVAAANDFSCGLRADNEAWCWGDNRFGQLGDGGGGTVFEPVAIDPGPFDSVASGSQNGCAIRSGQLWCWGANGFGQLGDGSIIERRRPVQIGIDEDWTSVAISRTYACGIRAPGTLWCWGNNEDRQLGIGGNIDARVPTQVGTATSWSEVAVTDRLTCGVLDTALHCWGEGFTSMPESYKDMRVRSLTGHDRFVTAIDATTNTGITIASFGQEFVESPLVNDWTTLDRGDNHICGLRGEGLWCLGFNFSGQFGRPVDNNEAVEAVQESTLGAWQAVSTGAQATCAIGTDNRLACMGTETLIGLGDGGRVDVATRVGIADWKAVSVGVSTTCGIQLDGSLHCWGLGNASGRGDGKGGHERPTRVAPP